MIESSKTPRMLITRFWKRVISAVCAIFVGVCVAYIDYLENDKIVQLIFYGFFIQFLTWDYCFKGIVRGLKNKFSNKRGKHDIDVEDDDFENEEDNEEEDEEDKLINEVMD